MREFIKTYEYIGNLQIEDFKFDNIRCVYADDLYSNKLMKGEFIVEDISKEVFDILGKRPKFTFEDVSGRVLKGEITGFKTGSEYFQKINEIKFKVEIFSHVVVWDDRELKSLKIDFGLPYIEDFSRHIVYSFLLYDEYIFKFNDEPKFIKINNVSIEIFENVYVYEYKEPDSIFTRELKLRIKQNINEGDSEADLLSFFVKLVNEISIVMSVLFNHRIYICDYYAEYFDENKKLLKTIKVKDSQKTSSDDLLKRANHYFSEYLNDENLSSLMLQFNKIDDNIKQDYENLVYKYLTIDETKIFEAKFLSCYVFLESFSKYIAKPTVRTKSEVLIKSAFNIAKIDYSGLQLSRHRQNNMNSANEWEITEYRDELIHFNGVEFDQSKMFIEFCEMMKLSRKLLLWFIVPELTDWPYPSKYNN